MKEVTRVLTMQITQIFVCDDERADRVEVCRKKLDKLIRELAKSEIGADHVKCHTQLFIREVENETN